MQGILLHITLLMIIICGQHEYINAKHKKYIKHPCQTQQIPLSFITNYQSKSPDGFGSQFQCIITSAIYAELNHKQFVYTPFKVMEHNYDNDPNFIEKKERFINCIDNFLTIDKIKANKKYTINSTIECKEFFDANVIKCSNSRALKKIKNIFRANKNTTNYFNNKNLNIAIHIRRPNPHDIRTNGTDMPDSIPLNIINQLRIMYTTKNPLFHLYSQGDSKNFALFNAPDILLHLNESVESTFLSMVLADVLVIGTSSFSYTAGLLSNGIVYYIPFWHAPLPHWISVQTLLSKQ